MRYLLKDVTTLNFPVIYFSKDLKDIKLDKTSLTFGEHTVYKVSDNIIDDFAAADAPSYAIYSCVSEFITSNFNKRGRRVFIDNKYNLIVINQSILTTLFTVPIDLETDQYFLSNQLPCYLEKVMDKQGKFPVVAKLNSTYYHIGWSNKNVYKRGKI